MCPCESVRDVNETLTMSGVCVSVKETLTMSVCVQGCVFDCGFEFVCFMTIDVPMRLPYVDESECF